MTVYAQWKINSASVVFDANGGLGTTTKSLTIGSQIGTLPTPTRSGYILVGWFTAPSGGTQITSSTTVSSDVTYYAQWRAPIGHLTVTAYDGYASGTATYNEFRQTGYKGYSWQNTTGTPVKVYLSLTQGALYKNDTNPRNAFVMLSDIPGRNGTTVLIADEGNYYTMKEVNTTITVPNGYYLYFMTEANSDTIITAYEVE